MIAITLSVATASSTDAHDLTELKRDEQGADVLGAVADSLRLLLLEHGSRML